ncbi:hypothetical protein Ae201684P_014463 [Aphanomyces euteiches]|uniref:Calcineurin-like phosphoesterase domain-containing protein n=1 Tax=Aphanomyces euteiches TaxID=100861 RepID=A0A6G0WRG7_9STRA|nr:hypothetical protein Ae201684_012483 [Aphanomyces euteiches]KAH9090668.1 hypothetical protein Ae201684P_014463 [Aphanomyces euteiches]
MELSLVFGIVAATAVAIHADRAPLLAKAANSTTLTYKILQVPDLHYTGDPTYKCSDPPTDVQKCTEAYIVLTDMLSKMLDDVQPDFVVFTWDQIESLIYIQNNAKANHAIDAYSAPVIARKLPWAMVFGNHDESYIPAISSEKKVMIKHIEELPFSYSSYVMIKHIEELPFSYSSYGPQDIGGVGNYELALQAPSDGSWGAAGTDVLRMYFLDTFKDGKVKDTQLSYFKSLAAAHKTKAPALMFFHIPLAEYNEFTGQGQGQKNEKVSATKSNGLFQAMVDMGDVKAAFVGHDHKNNFCFLKTPIHLCYGGGVGYGAYGDKTIPRMARVIEWSKSPDVESIVTWQYKQNTANTYDKYTIYNQVRS